jgi:hypothetical protein
MAVPQGLARYRQEGNVWTGQGHATTLCYLERRNYAIALALYRAAETTATRALRERAEQRRIRPLIVRSDTLERIGRGDRFATEAVVSAHLPLVLADAGLTPDTGT